MNKGDKYIITQFRLHFADGTHSTVKTRKEVFNIQSYREYLMATHGAERVEFIYETIPADKQGKVKVRLQ